VKSARGAKGMTTTTTLQDIKRTCELIVKMPKRESASLEEHMREAINDTLVLAHMHYNPKIKRLEKRVQNLKKKQLSLKEGKE
jgi:hypothetical protein